MSESTNPIVDVGTAQDLIEDRLDAVRIRRLEELFVGTRAGGVRKPSPETHVEQRHHKGRERR